MYVFQEQNGSEDASLKGNSITFVRPTWNISKNDDDVRSGNMVLLADSVLWFRHNIILQKEHLSKERITLTLNTNVTDGGEKKAFKNV